MRISIVLAIYLLLQGMEVAQSRETISFVGIDENGNEINEEVTPRKFQNKLGLLIKKFNLATLPSLEKHASKSNDANNKQWRLKKLELGASLTGAVGVGSVMKISANPTFVLVYKKKRSK